MKMKNKYSAFILTVLVSFLAVLYSGCGEEPNTSTPETGTLTDIDGNIYKTVKIGDKWWMAENLKVKRYLNGDSIAFVAKNKPDTDWSNLKTGAYCSIEEKYGHLYNFYTITDSRNIAPAGWHIPTDVEWKEVEMFLAMNSLAADSVNWRGTDQGNKLKVAGGSTSDWENSSDKYGIFGTNESGFSAIGSTCRIFNGQWGVPGHTAFWWTSSLNGTDVWYRGLDYNKANVFRYSGSVNYGFSIRCVMD